MITDLTLNVGGLLFEVRAPARWVAPLARAWAGWVVSASDLELASNVWRITVTVDASLPRSSQPLYAALPAGSRGDVALLGPGYEARVQVTSSSAYLRAHAEGGPADLSYLLRVALAVRAFYQEGGMLFHTAAVVHRGRGFALFGLSGSGKTTAAQLSEPDPVLDDDLVLLRPADDGWVMYGTPFGKHRGVERSAAVHAFLRLVQDSEVYLAPLPRSYGLADLVANTPVIAGDAAGLPDLMARWHCVMATVPVMALHFRKDPSFWEVVDAEFG